jgi:hypothetical protein
MHRLARMKDFYNRGGEREKAYGDSHGAMPWRSPTRTGTLGVSPTGTRTPPRRVMECA